MKQNFKMEFNPKDWDIEARPYRKGEAFIKKYKGTSSQIVFPSEVEGMRVTGIKDRVGVCPANYANLTSVIIPYGYEYIGSHAFAGCYNLEEINIPPTVSEICRGAFEGCAALKEIVIPPGITSVCGPADGGFAKDMLKDCLSLTDVYWLAKEVYAGTNPFGKYQSFTLHGEPTIEVKKYAPQKKCVPLTDDEKHNFAKQYFSVAQSEIIVGLQPLCGKIKVGDVLSCRVDSVSYELKTCVVNENDDIIAYVARDVVVGFEDFVSVTVTKIEQDESSKYAEVSIKYKTIYSNMRQ